MTRIQTESVGLRALRRTPIESRGILGAVGLSVSVMCGPKDNLKSHSGPP